ncbi:MAG TPA: extracellular solute-binding protein [Chloroflexota bacterium]|jgi:multiple sugar transport system substrate-binding protein|nr:extracellular solute-binding protein [Chloroflexota bacterium]
MFERDTAGDPNPAWERRLSRRGVLKAGAALVAAGAASGIVPTRAARAERADATTTIRFMTRGGVGYEKYFRDAAAQFQHLNPSIQIKIEPQDQNYKDKLTVEIAGGTAPDMVFGADDNLFSFAARGTLRELTPYWQKSGLKASDYWASAINSQKLGPHLFAMPLDYGMWMLQYNKAIFDRAHLRYPDLSWTWDDFVRVTRKLTIDNKGRTAEDPAFDPHHVVQHGNDGGLNWSWNVLLRSQGLEWAVPDLSKSLLDDPRVIQQFQWIADLGNKYYVTPSPKFPSGVNWDLGQGNLATFFGGSWDVSNGWTVKWDTTGFPMGKAGRAVVAEASGLIIPAQASHPAEAWQFIQWMSTAAGQRMALNYGVATIPSVKSLAHQVMPAVKTPPHAPLILDLVPKAGLPFWCEAISDSELEGILITSPWPDMTRLYAGQEMAATVMPRVARQVNAILAADQTKAKQFGATLRL